MGGLLVAARKDHTGEVYHYLEMVSYAYSGGSKGYGAVWNVRCACGVVKQVLAKNVTSGKIKSCGTCEYHTKVKKEAAKGVSKVRVGEYRLFNRYMKRARGRGIGWCLNSVEFQQRIMSNCDLCGAVPNGVIKGLRTKHNQCERIDMKQPFSFDNTLTLCKKCASLKNKLNLEDFLKRVLAIASHISK